MRSLPICCVLLVLLGAVTQASGDSQFVKLCGREFIRAVIYTCGGSRWRRLLSTEPQVIPGRGQIFDLRDGDVEVAEPLEFHLQRINSQNAEAAHQSESLEEFWDSEKNPIQERRDLNELLTTACCKTGCKKKDLSSLC
ncbi:insulin-like peptide INSL5 [Spea bombifrons]|uniref:insulin-like peptide INSL5 n=1 Tax=Spea bombifrons TaxID=233779 RepID=UPI00234A8FF6|nr:insulin-like peptide INSL5 [Spea bombifrons]